MNRNRITVEMIRELNLFAQQRQYDDINVACTYTNDPNPTFAAEGQYCINIRSAMWTALLAIFDDIDAGNRPEIGSYQQIYDELPHPAWPE